MENGISLGELARRLDRDKGGLSRLAKKGRIPRNPDGTYEEQAVRSALKNNTNPARAKPLPGGVDQQSTVNTEADAREAVTPVQKILAEEGEGDLTGFDAARTAETILKVRERDIGLAKTRGELVDKQKTLAKVFALARAERDIWQQWPARVAALMAAELQVDPHRMEAILDSYVRQHLGELADIHLDIG